MSRLTRHLHIWMVVLAACGGGSTDPGTPPPPPPPPAVPPPAPPPVPPARIEVDSSKAVQAVVGPTGGSLTLINGTTKFLLDVPPGAVDVPVNLVMRPLKALRELPAAGQFIAAVQFDPTGTSFRKPLTLKVVQQVTVVSGSVIAGYLADDAGNITELAPADRVGDTLFISIPHFSVGGWGQFVPAQFPPAPPLPPTGSTFNTYVSNFHVEEAVQSPLATFVTLFQDWRARIIDPDLAHAILADQILDAGSEATLWYSYIKEADTRLFRGALETALLNDVVAVRGVLNTALKQGITQFNNRCGNNVPGVFAVDAVRAFMLQDMAPLWKLDDVAHGLDLPTVVSQSCLTLVNTVANFPAQPTPGQAAQLDLRYGVKFGAQSLLVDAVVGVSLDLFGTTNDGNQHLQTDAQGRLSGAVTPTGVGDFTAFARACIHPSNGLFLDRICNNTTVTRPFGITVNGNVQVQSQVGLSQISNVRKIVGNLFIFSPGGAQAITSTDLIELRGLREVTGNLTLSNMPSVTTLTGLAGLITVGGNLGLLNLQNITTLAPLGTLDYHGLLLSQMNGLTTLSGLKAPPNVMTGGIDLFSNSHLFDVSIFKNVTSIDGNFQFSQNPLFANLNDIGALTHVGGNATIGGSGLTSVAALAHLQTVDGDLQVMVNDLDLLSAFSLPALTTVGGDLRTSIARPAQAGVPTSLLPVSFPALTHILGGEIGGGNGGGAVRPWSLSLPALTAVALNGSAVNIDNSFGLRDLTIGALNTAAGAVNIDNNPQLQTLTIGTVSTSGVFNLDNNPALLTAKINGAFQADLANVDNNVSLQTMTFGGAVTIVGVLNVDNNKVMTTLQFNGGSVGATCSIDNNALLANLLGPLASVGGDLNVDHNPKLSQQAAMAWAAGVAVAGAKHINNNGAP